MKIADHIFKAYDIRGLVPDELDEDTVNGIGRAFADFLYNENETTRSRPIVVGRDMREDSAALANAAISGITAQGRDVIDIGQVTTDMIYYAVGSMEAAGGIVVTASHNSGAYNGMKLCREEARAVGIETGLLDIRERVQSESFRVTEPGSVTEQNITDEWVTHALKFATGLKPLHIAVDAGNGMAGAVIPYLKEKTPLEITPMYFELDGTFPNHEANPMKTETLDNIRQVVVNSKLDFGIAFDGDGDRMMLIDDTGEPVSGSITMAMLARHFLKLYPGSTILHNAITSRVVPETIEQCGGVPVRIKVGHSYIKAKMRVYDAPFGGEHSAHYYFRDNWYADSGLIAAVVAMSVISESGTTLSEIVQPYREAYVHSNEMNFEVADKEAVIQRVAEAFNDGEQDWLDGLTVNYEDWWFNLRPSNTEPLLRLNVEARRQKKIEETIGILKNQISNQGK